MSVKFRVYVDWANDGNFTGTYDEITKYVYEVSVRAGTADPYELMAGAGGAKITLYNRDKVFSPDYGYGPLVGNVQRGRSVKIDVSDGASTWTIFRGVIDDVQPSSGQAGQNRWSVTLSCIDYIGVMQRTNIDLPLQLNRRVDEIVQMVVNAGLNAPAAAGAYYTNTNLAVNYTVTINDQVYRFVSALAQANDVLIDLNPSLTLNNLSAAINGTAGSGTKYHASTSRPTGLTAKFQGAEAHFYTSGSSGLAIGAVGGTPQWLGVPFMLSVGGVLDQITFYLAATTGAPTGTLTWEIRSDSSGLPGTVLQSGTVSPTANATNTVNVAGGITLTAGTLYHFTLKPTSAQTGTNYWTWRYLANPVYTYQYSTYTLNSGASWFKLNGQQFDFMVAIKPIVAINAMLRGVIGNGYTLAQSGATFTITAMAGGADYPGGIANVLESGQTLAMAGDNWSGERTNAMSALQELAKTEYGRIFQQLDGAITFYNRKHNPLNQSVASVLTLNGEVFDLQAGMDDLANKIRCTVHPRSTAISTQVVGKADTPLNVPPGGTARVNPTDAMQTTTTKIQHRDPATGRFLGVKSLSLPLVAGTDYTVWTDATAGTDITSAGYISTSVVQNGASSEVTFVNSSSNTVFIRGLQVRGIAVTAYDPVTKIVEDTSSQSSYGKVEYAVDMPFESSEITALSIAQYLLNQRKTPKIRIKGLNWGNITLVGPRHKEVNLFGIKLGDIITFSDPQLGITTQRYMVIGIRMQISAGDGTKASKTPPATPKTSISWDVKLMDQDRYWVLNDATAGVLGSTTTLYI